MYKDFDKKDLHVLFIKRCVLQTLSPFTSLMVHLGCVYLNWYHHEFIGIPSLNCVPYVWVNFAIFNLSYYNVIDSPHFCIPNVQSTIIIIFIYVNTPNGPCFLDLVLSLKWFDSDVKVVVHLFFWLIVVFLCTFVDLWLLFCGGGIFFLLID